MPDVLDDLARQFEQLSRRRHAWTAVPPVSLVVPPGTHEVLGRLVHLVGDDTGATGSARSDQAVRALAQVGADEPDALVVLLHALSPHLRRRLRRSVTPEHTAEAVSDLVFVVTDAVAAGELHRLPRLAHRLVNRAHNRTYKRYRHYDLTRSPQLIEATTALPSPDLADAVAARFDLARFVESVERSVGAGEMSARGWDAYRHQRLDSSITGEPPRATVNDRNLASRAARKLRPHIEAHLLCHTP